MPRRWSGAEAVSNAGCANYGLGQGWREQKLRELGLCAPCVRRLSLAGFTGTARDRLVCPDCERRGYGPRAFELSIPRPRAERDNSRRVYRDADTGQIYDQEEAA
jgi:hypothetical protein